MRKTVGSILLAAALLLCSCTGPVSDIMAPPQDFSSPPPSPPSPPRASVAAVGDNLIHSYIYKKAKALAGGEGYDFLPMYAQAASVIKSADLAFLNQETPLGGEALGLSGYPLFNSPKELARDMAALGFDVVNHTTNHILDRGEPGLRNTLEAWKQFPGVLVVGAYESQEELERIHVIERGGIRFAVLAYGYGTNGLTLPAASPYRIAPVDEELMLRQTAQARAMEDVDAVLVSVHWGAEDSMQIEDWQRVLAKKLAQKGADVLIGHHPHVLRPIEWVHTGDGRRMLCAYSLGNFISTQKDKNNLLGGILTFDAQREAAGGVRIENIGFLPTIVYYNQPRSDVRIVFLENFTNEMARTHGAAAEHSGGLSREYYVNLAAGILRTDATKYEEEGL